MPDRYRIKGQTFEQPFRFVELPLLNLAATFQNSEVFFDPPTGFIPLADAQRVIGIGIDLAFGTQQQPVQSCLDVLGAMTFFH